MSRSAFDQWRKQVPSARQRSDREFEQEDPSGPRHLGRHYGAPRVHDELRDLGWRIGQETGGPADGCAGLAGPLAAVIVVAAVLDVGPNTASTVPGTGDRYPSPAQGDLAVLGSVPVGVPLRVVLAFRAGQLGDFRLHQLAHHLQPDTH